MINKLDVRFHVQWELERLVAKSKMVEWRDFQASDFDSLSGCAVDAFPKVQYVLDTVHIRKTGSKQSRNPHSVLHERGSMTSRKTRMLVEVDKEEESIRANDLRGLYNDSVDWPFGGRSPIPSLSGPY